MIDVEKKWKSLLSEIVHDGHSHHKDDQPIREVLSKNFFVQNPVLDKAFFFPHPARRFLDWIREGVFDIEDYPLKGDALADYVASFGKPDHIYLDGPDSFVYTYPERIRNIDADLARSTDQFEVMAQRLIENRGSNRAVATLYSARMDGDREDIPCLNWMQFSIRENSLILHVMFRSNDIYGAWPSNMYFLTYVGLLMQERLEERYPSLIFDGIDYHVSSAHIYETDMEMAKKIIE